MFTWSINFKSNMKFILVFNAFLLLLFTQCITKTKEQPQPKNTSKDTSQSNSVEEYQLTYQDIISDTSLNNEHFRGLFIQDNDAFIAGSKGTVMTYNFQNQTNIKDSLGFQYHFRDIHFINETLYLMSIQSPAALIIQDQNNDVRINQEEDSLAFLDGMDFWDNGEGILFGDPVDLYPYVTKLTADQKFMRAPSSKLPELALNEAGFAASGTSIDCIGNGVAYIGWGGDEVRVFKTTDYGEAWTSQNTPMPKHQTGTGIYSLDFKDEMNGVAVGGNWEYPECDSSKIYTNDGGKTWLLSKGIQGYRSCVTHVTEDTYISTGTNGTDISYDGGKNWQMLDTIGFNAIQFSEITDGNINGIGVGNYGLIKLVQLKKK